MRPGTAFGLAIAGAALLLACGVGGVALLVAGRGQPSARVTEEAAAQPVEPVKPAPPAEPQLSDRVSGRTYRGGDSRFYARMFRDADEDTSDAGLRGLVAIGDDYAVKVIVEAYPSARGQRGRLDLLIALHDIGPGARATLPFLRGLAAEDRDKDIREHAALAIKQIQP